MTTKSDAATDEYEQRYMQPGESVLFREKIVSRTAFGLSVAFMAIFGLVGLVSLIAAAIGALPPAVGLGFGAPPLLFGVVMGVLGAMFSVFRVMVTASNVHVHFGWSKRKIPFAAIRSIRAVTLEGVRQGKVSIGLDALASFTGILNSTPLRSSILGRRIVSIPAATSAVASGTLTVQRNGTSRLNLP